MYIFHLSLRSISQAGEGETREFWANCALQKYKMIYAPRILKQKLQESKYLRMCIYVGISEPFVYLRMDFVLPLLNYTILRIDLPIFLLNRAWVNNIKGR